jgi:hypothetical protein
MTTKQLCISADSHVVESAEFFKQLQKRFGQEVRSRIRGHQSPRYRFDGRREG